MDGPTFDAKRFKNDPEINNYSGLGSTIDNTKEIRKALPNIIKTFEVKSIIDAPCGDCSWIKFVDTNQVDYFGYDILDLVLEQARKNYPVGTFQNIDITEHSFWAADLIICRDFLFHISFEKAIKVLDKFRASGSRLLLTSSFMDDKHDDLIQNGSYKYCKDYSFRPINLRLAPFNLPEPILKFSEMEGMRYMGLWNIN